jgi:hypothetical protein
MINQALYQKFKDRYPLLRSRMFELTGQVLSLDFVYEPGRKVRVYGNRSQSSFCPYKCMSTTCNVDNMVVRFGMLQLEESAANLQPHLKNFIKDSSDWASQPKSSSMSIIVVLYEKKSFLCGQKLLSGWIYSTGCSNRIRYSAIHSQWKPAFPEHK